MLENIGISILVLLLMTELRIWTVQITNHIIITKIYQRSQHTRQKLRIKLHVGLCERRSSHNTYVTSYAHYLHRKVAAHGQSLL
jgi:hypothetical protein